ncbi:MAG: hypothetical protein WD770_01385 [Actinomycetota bacterium]
MDRRKQPAKRASTFIAVTAIGAGFGALCGLAYAMGSGTPDTSSSDCMFIAYCNLGESPILRGIVALFYMGVGMGIGAVLGGTIAGLAATLTEPPAPPPIAAARPATTVTEIRIDEGATYGRIDLR